MTKLLALAASPRPDSLNKKLLAIAVQHATQAGANVTEIEYSICDVPTYHDGANLPYPEGATRLHTALMAHDGLILASPEYNWSMPGGLKNLIDWLSTHTQSPFRGRHALLLCASPSVRGGILGLNQLSLPLAHLGMHVYPHLVAIGNAHTELKDGQITNTKDAKFLADCVHDFVRIAKK